MRRYPIAPWRFREARLSCGLSVAACTEPLQVTERTVRNWESGMHRMRSDSIDLSVAPAKTALFSAAGCVV